MIVSQQMQDRMDRQVLNLPFKTMAEFLPLFLTGGDRDQIVVKGLRQRTSYYARRRRNLVQDENIHRPTTCKYYRR